MRAHIILLFLLLFAGCLDLLRYSESTYRYTITLPPNSTMICEFNLGELTNVSYELSSDNLINFKLIDVDVIDFDPETGIGNITYTELRRIDPGYNVYRYSDKTELSPGLYNLVIFGSETKSEITLETNIEMDCG
jgi:hypothetical protein